MRTEDKLREFIESLAEEGCDHDETVELEARLIGDINRLRRGREGRDE